MELWVEIRDFPNYEVSSEGRVRSKITGRILKPGTNNGGYKTVTLRRDGRSFGKTVHRLVARTFYDVEDESLDVNHDNGLKTDNRVQNLDWATRRENVNHAYRTGLRKIRPVIDLDTGETYDSASAFAKEIGASLAGVCDVLNGRSPRIFGRRVRYYA